jgi:hypothetical protein
MNFRRTAWLASAVAAAVSAQTPAPSVAPAELRPYEASYELVTHGLNAGVSSFDLRQDGADTWTFVSHNRPRGMFRLFSSASLTLTSHMRVSKDGVQPLLFTATPPMAAHRRPKCISTGTKSRDRHPGWHAHRHASQARRAGRPVGADRTGARATRPRASGARRSTATCRCAPSRNATAKSSGR